LTEGQGVALTRTLGQAKGNLQYLRSEKTLKKTVVCLKKTAQSKQAIFRDRLIDMKELLVSKLSRKITMIKEIRDSAEKKLMLLPKIGNDTNTTTDYIRTPQKTIEYVLDHELPNLRNALTERVGKIVVD
jgi:hypothetical protein